jgi:hypothetical protein
MHEHISLDRFIEIGNGSPATPEEEQKQAECDYCVEGVLLGFDPDKWNERYKK